MKYEYDNFDKLNSIEVTLAIGCKLDCHYCPQQLLLDRYFSENRKRSSMMSFEDFKKILSKVKNGGTICFSGMCEPFLNPECDDMIVYAYEKGFRVTLLTTLVGLRKESIEKLKEVEFDGITLHIPDEEGHSKFVITDEYLEMLKLFHDNFKINNYSCHGSIHPTVKKYIDEEVICFSKMLNRAGNLDYGLSMNPKGPIICMVGAFGGYGNWCPEILPDGTMLLCCMDYGMRHVLGNLLNMGVREILDGKEYQKVQEGMRDDSLDILCRKCNRGMEIEKIPAYRFMEARQKFIQKKAVEPKQQRILKLFAENKNVCIFGLGKLFWDNFFNQKWNEVLGQTYFCDNCSELWGTEIGGVRCITPEELRRLDNALVVTHMADDKSVRKQLKKMGIENIVNIKEIYGMV